MGAQLAGSIRPVQDGGDVHHRMDDHALGRAAAYQKGQGRVMILFAI